MKNSFFLKLFVSTLFICTPGFAASADQFSDFNNLVTELKKLNISDLDLNNLDIDNKDHLLKLGNALFNPPNDSMKQYSFDIFTKIKFTILQDNPNAQFRKYLLRMIYNFTETEFGEHTLFFWLSWMMPHFSAALPFFNEKGNMVDKSEVYIDVFNRVGLTINAKSNRHHKVYRFLGWKNVSAEAISVANVEYNHHYTCYAEWEDLVNILYKTIEFADNDDTRIDRIKRVMPIVYGIMNEDISKHMGFVNYVKQLIDFKKQKNEKIEEWEYFGLQNIIR